MANEADLRIGIDARPAEAGAARVNAAFRGVQRSAAQTVTPVSQVDKAFNDINRSATRLQTPLVHVQRAFAAIGASIGLAVLVNTGARLDSLRRGMDAVSESAAQAEIQLDRLQEVAKLPGLGFEEAIQGAINLQAVGFSAGQTIDILKGFGNAIATVGGGKAELDRATVALTQMAAAGRVLGQDVRQLQQVIPQIRRLMVDEFGVSSGEALSDLGVTADEFVTRITRRLLELPQVTGGARNAFENFSDGTKRAMDTVFQAIEPVVVGTINLLGNLSGKIGDLDVIQLRSLGTAAAKAAASILLVVAAYKSLALASVAAGVAQATVAFLQLVPAITSVRDALTLLQFAMGPTGWLIVGVSALTAGFYLLQRSQREQIRINQEVEKTNRDLGESFSTLSQEQAEATLLAAQATQAQFRSRRALLALDLAEAQRRFTEEAAKPRIELPTGTRVTDEYRNAQQAVENLIKSTDELKNAEEGVQSIINSVTAALERYAKSAKDQLTEAQRKLAEQFKETRAEMELETRQLRESLAIQGASKRRVDDLTEAQRLQREEFEILQKFGSGAYSETLIKMAREQSALRRGIELTVISQQEQLRLITQLDRSSGRALAVGQRRFLDRPPPIQPVRELTIFDPDELREKTLIINREYIRSRDQRLQLAAEEGDAIIQIFEETARGVQRTLASGFDDLFEGGVDSAEDFARSLVDVMREAAAQIAALFASEALGIDKLLDEIRTAREENRRIDLSSLGLAGQIAKYGGGALIGAAAGYQSGVGAGVLSGGLSGLALGGPVAGILGAVGGLVGGLLGQSDKAREAAERMRKAREAFSESLDRLVEDVALRGGNDFDRAITDLRRRFEERILEFNELSRRVDVRTAATNTIPEGTPIERARTQLEALEEALGRVAFAEGVLSQEYIDLARLTEAYRDELERLEAELAAAQAAFREDIELRSLIARGLTEEAALRRHELEQQRELDDARRRGFDDATIAALEALHAEEDLAFARQRAAEAAQRESERLSFGADLAAREARLGGDDRGALAIELAERSRRELEAAQKLLDAGTITQEQFDRLALLLDGEVIRALEDFDKALRDAKQAAFDDLAIRKLMAQGLSKEAEELRLTLRHQREVAEAEELKLGEEFLKELRDVQRLELDALRRADASLASGSAAIDRAAEDEVIRSVTGISATQAQTLVELTRTEIGILRSIDANIRKLKPSTTTVPSVSTNAGAPTVTSRPGDNFQITVNVIGGGAGSARAIEQGVVESIDRALETRLSTTLITTGEPRVFDPRLTGFA